MHSSSRPWLHDHNASTAHRANPLIFSPSLPMILQERAHQAILESQSGMNLFSTIYPQSNFTTSTTDSSSTRTGHQQQQIASIQGMFPFLSSEGTPTSASDQRFLAAGTTVAGSAFGTTFYEQGVPQQVSTKMEGGQRVQPDSVRQCISTLALQNRNEQIRAYIHQVQEERRKIFGSILSSLPPR